MIAKIVVKEVAESNNCYLFEADYIRYFVIKECDSHLWLNMEKSIGAFMEKGWEGWNKAAYRIGAITGDNKKSVLRLHLFYYDNTFMKEIAVAKDCTLYIMNSKGDTIEVLTFSDKVIKK